MPAAVRSWRTFQSISAGESRFGIFGVLTGYVVPQDIAPRRGRACTKGAAIAALHLDVGYHSTTIRTGVACAE